MKVRSAFPIVITTTVVLLLLGSNNALCQPITVPRLYVCVSPAGEVRIIGLAGGPTRCQIGWKEVIFPGVGPQGAVGPTGPAGPQGAPGSPGGLMCWDANGNGAGDPAEDRNGDGLFNALDCRGPSGLSGATGATGAQGPAGLQGPVGPAGPSGPAGPAGTAGPAVKTVAVCVSADGSGSKTCSFSGGLVSRVSSDCHVTSETGDCHAYGEPIHSYTGQCCVCRP